MTKETLVLLQDCTHDCAVSRNSIGLETIYYFWFGILLILIGYTLRRAVYRQLDLGNGERGRFVVETTERLLKILRYNKVCMHMALPLVLAAVAFAVLSFVAVFFDVTVEQTASAVSGSTTTTAGPAMVTNRCRSQLTYGQ